MLHPSDLRDCDDPRALLTHARTLVGRSIREVDSANRLYGMSKGLPKTTHKGGIGRVVEEYFGFRHQDNNPAPDFARCDTELKTLPLLKTKAGFRVKERTIISMIDFKGLPGQTWLTSSVRRKLTRVLFVFVEWDMADQFGSTVHEAENWEPSESDLAFFEADWRYTWRMVCCGQADLISEADALFLAPCRKGVGQGKDLRPQPNSPILANSRAFSLKPAFTTETFKEIIEGKRFQSVVSEILPRIRDRGFREVEQRLMDSMRPLVGKTLGEVGTLLRIDLSGGKDRAARIVRRVLGSIDLTSEIREFLQAGSQIKTLSLSGGDGRAFESVSFPAADLERLVIDSWEDSQLRQDLSRVLFVPTYRSERRASPTERTLGQPFFWTPTEEQWEVIEREWTDYKQQVADGRARYEPVESTGRRRSLLKHESETKIIHMRPHGANAADEVRNPQGMPVTRQCFWLNHSFVAKLAEESSRRN
jgi:DNA mismatch repair protein MutH